MADKQKYTKNKVEKALADSRGAVALAAESLGCQVNTVYNYLKRYPELQDTLDHYREKRVDKAELKLEQAINEGQPWAIALTLKTLGKSRGYVEKQEVEQVGASVIRVEYVKRSNGSTDGTASGTASDS